MRKFAGHHVGGARAVGARVVVRGFTLIEVMLAAILAVIVVAMCISVMYALQRGDVALMQRQEETNDLQAMRFVMQRSFGSILVSDQSASARQGRGASGAGGPVEGPVLPPRILLDVSPYSISGDAGAMEALAVADAESVAGGDGVVQLSMAQPQRLELVLTDPPVPVTRLNTFQAAKLVIQQADRRASRTERAKQEDRNKSKSGETGIATAEVVTGDGSEEEAEEELPVRAFRGAFELRPELKPRELANGQSVQAWELWWVPLPARRIADAAMNPGFSEEPKREKDAVDGVALVNAALAEPFRVAGNIKALRWRFFDDREKKTAYRGVQYRDLPAYIECAAETTSGQRVEWLFEVGWASGPEVRGDKAPAMPGRTAPVATPVPDASGGAGGGGAGGAKSGGAK